MKQRLLAHIESVASSVLRRTCYDLFTERFFTAPAANSRHHAYEGGLMAHTVEVADYARHISACMGGQENTDILIVASVWHDYAKVYEYAKTHEGAWEFPTYSSQIGHIAGSAAAFSRSALMHEVYQSDADAIMHCILAHHGPVKEWGSPVAPQTIEALILHQADMLSANYGATKNATV